MKRSAGVLPYKIVDNNIYVYLEHPGGPYWKNIERYSICKGEYNKKKEKVIDCAIREFYEESGTKVDKDKLKFLYSHKVSKRKLVTIFIVDMDIDCSKMKSNTFIKEMPKGSGNFCEFPEMDYAKWFLIDDAYKVIFNNQDKFLDKIIERVM